MKDDRMFKLSSIVYHMFEEQGIVLSREIAEAIVMVADDDEGHSLGELRDMIGHATMKEFIDALNKFCWMTNDNWPALWQGNNPDHVPFEGAPVIFDGTFYTVEGEPDIVMYEGETEPSGMGDPIRRKVLDHHRIMWPSVRLYKAFRKYRH